MLRRHRLAAFLLRPSRKSIAPAGDPAKPLATPEPPAIQHYPHSPKNADKVAASRRRLDLKRAELRTRGGTVFPLSPATIHRADRVCRGPRRHFPAPTFPRIRDKARSKLPAQGCPLDLPARQRRTVCLLSWLIYFPPS